jgi:hypothetical protein
MGHAESYPLPEHTSYYRFMLLNLQFSGPLFWLSLDLRLLITFKVPSNFSCHPDHDQPLIKRYTSGVCPLTGVKICGKSYFGEK